MTRKSKREIEARLDGYAEAPRKPTLVEVLSPEVFVPIDEERGIVRNPVVGELVKYPDYFDGSDGGGA